MAVATDASRLSVAWWREPTKDQWLAWIAAWLGWMLDAFDFTIFLLLIAARPQRSSSSPPTLRVMLPTIPATPAPAR
jgi:hypothetical protein